MQRPKDRKQYQIVHHQGGAVTDPSGSNSAIPREVTGEAMRYAQWVTDAATTACTHLQDMHGGQGRNDPPFSNRETGKLHCALAVRSGQSVAGESVGIHANRGKQTKQAYRPLLSIFFHQLLHLWQVAMHKNGPSCLKEDPQA